MTLIELLVVIIIITTIVAAAIPIMAPANDDRRVREASRGLNTFLTGAQARAISTNRPFGVALKRLGSDTGRAEDNVISLEAFYVEQAPPYSGFDANSRVCIAIHPDPPKRDANNNDVNYPIVLIRFVTRGTTGASLPYGWTEDLFPQGTIRPGDVLETGGTRYELLRPMPDDDYYNITVDTNDFYGPPRSRVPTIAARPLNDSGQQINPRYDNNGNILGADLPNKAPYWAAPSPYKVLRQATPTADEPYQLPEGTAIDLRASGVGSDEYFYVRGLHDNSQGVLIMFAPEGRVSRVSFSRSPYDVVPFDEPVIDNVFLLLGKRENVPPLANNDPTLSSAAVGAADTDEKRAALREPINWLNGTSRWIVLGSQSGRIVTVENSFVDPAEIVSAIDPTILSESSEELRNQQILAAREITREMAQLGGR